MLLNITPAFIIYSRTCYWVVLSLFFLSLFLTPFSPYLSRFPVQQLPSRLGWGPACTSTHETSRWRFFKLLLEKTQVMSWSLGYGWLWRRGDLISNLSISWVKAVLLWRTRAPSFTRLVLSWPLTTLSHNITNHLPNIVLVPLGPLKNLWAVKAWTPQDLHSEDVLFYLAPRCLQKTL